MNSILFWFVSKVKQQVCEVGHLPTPAADVKNKWSYTTTSSSPPYRRLRNLRTRHAVVTGTHKYGFMVRTDTNLPSLFTFVLAIRLSARPAQLCVYSYQLTGWKTSARDFSVLFSVHTDSGVHQASHSTSTGDSSLC
jgi:hypothetical protein